MRPTEEADKIIKKVKKEPTDASEPGSREDVRVMDEESSARAQYRPERPEVRPDLPEEPAEGSSDEAVVLVVRLQPHRRKRLHLRAAAAVVS